MNRGALQYSKLAAILIVALLVFGYPLATPTSRGSAKQRSRHNSSSLETIQFHSKLLNKTLPHNAILPRDYRTSSTRYPVLYLLHGLSGHYSDWMTKTNIVDYAASYRMIVVMPEGNDGWYTDSATVSND